METATLTYLLGLALVTGVMHTAMGPDHYLPFIMMGRAGRWSTRKTLAITAVCGVGHVLGSVVLGAVGILVGLSIGGLEAFESFRGDVAAWLLVGFGLAYTAWGVRAAMRNKPHTHWHQHADGTVHNHEHHHHGDHLHVHDEKGRAAVTAWALFVVFIFGPCEVLIPQLMYPAARHDWWGVLWVTLVFAAATICTMLFCVGLVYAGLQRIRLPGLERFAHVAAGAAVTLCGFAILFGL